MTKIEWTDEVWNPVTGCTKISAGCKNCYAERMAKRLQAMGQRNYVNGFNPTTHDHMLERPLKWKKPRRVFVNSMSDLFHKDVSSEFIQKVFQIMNETPQHTYQLLTKRPLRALHDIAHLVQWTTNIWMGVSIENDKQRWRMETLKNIPAYRRFLSIEPLIGEIQPLDLNGVDWVIVGGESGSGARPMKEEWVTNIRDWCVESRTAFFFKQWGGVNKKKTGNLLEGETWNQMPPQ